MAARILIVDDEPDVRVYLTAVLEDNGYEIETAIDGDDAFAKITTWNPDVITLDISMPQKSGVRFYRELKQSSLWSEIPIVVVTGVNLDFDRSVTKPNQLPAPDGYHVKPIDVGAFLETIAELVG